MKKKLLAGIVTGVVVLGHVMSANAAPVRWAVESGGNGHLATITSAEENAFVNSLVGAFGAYELGGYQPNPAPYPSEGWEWPKTDV